MSQAWPYRRYRILGHNGSTSREYYSWTQAKKDMGALDKMQVLKDPKGEWEVWDHRGYAIAITHQGRFNALTGERLSGVM